MDLTREEVVRDAQDGRAKLAFGNPVLCMDWVKDMVAKYDGIIDAVSENLTTCQTQPCAINPVADVSILVARLERYMRTFEQQAA